MNQIDLDIAQLEEHLKLKRLEKKLVDAKESGPASEKLKLQVRAARQHFRDNWRDRVVVYPENISAPAGVEDATVKEG